MPRARGSHSVSFDAIRPISLVSGDTTDPIALGGTFTQDFAKDIDYTIFAYGTLADVKTMTIDEPSETGRHRRTTSSS